MRIVITFVGLVLVAPCAVVAQEADGWVGPRGDAQLAVPGGYETEALPPPPPPPPPPAAPAPTQQVAPAPRRARVEIMADGRNAPMLHVWVGESWRAVCAPPCTRTVDRGEYRVALSRGNDPGLVVEEPVVIDGDVDLRVEYVDRSSDRAGGAVLIVGSLLVAGGLGGGMLAFTLSLAGRSIGESFLAVLTGLVSVIGFAGGIAMLIAGCVLAARPDIASVEAHPSFVPRYAPELLTGSGI